VNTWELDPSRWSHQISSAFEEGIWLEPTKSDITRHATTPPSLAFALTLALTLTLTLTLTTHHSHTLPHSTADHGDISGRHVRAQSGHGQPPRRGSSHDIRRLGRLALHRRSRNHDTRNGHSSSSSGGSDSCFRFRWSINTRPRKKPSSGHRTPVTQVVRGRIQEFTGGQTFQNHGDAGWWDGIEFYWQHLDRQWWWWWWWWWPAGAATRQ
jgi:hypothetical protein